MSYATPSIYPHTHTFPSAGQYWIRVLKDDAPIERTDYSDREVADSDKQLGTFPHNPTFPIYLFL